VFLFAVDMSKIAEDKLKYYPEVFKKMHAEYKKNGVKWQDVPEDISVCMKADPGIIDYSIPLFAAVIPSLYKIADADERYDKEADNKNYKMIAGQSPVDEDGNPKMDYDMFIKYYKHLTANISDKIGLAVSPFKLSAFDFEKSNSASEVDEISRCTANYWSHAGTSGLLHGIPNNTAGVTKLAIKNDESYMFGLMRQAERLINRFLKTEITGKVQFKIAFLPVTVFNREEYIKLYKEAASFGIGKSHYIAALGIPQFDIAGLNYIEKEILNLDTELSPLANTYNTGAGGDAGRPKTNDADLTPSGEAARGNDTNANR